MDVLKYIQQAIAYMEANLRESIHAQDVAQQVGMSYFHFNRLFTIMCNISIADYLRSRRLSEAGILLAATSHKVIDVAFLYGYQSAESFSRAFSQFHGFAPSKAKESVYLLRKFEPLHLSVQFQGGETMQYQIIERPAISLKTIQSMFSQQRVNDYPDIPEFWDSLINQGKLQALQSLNEDSALYGVCGPTVTDNDMFVYAIGVESTNDSDLYESYVIPASQWAVFECLGHDGSDLERLWTYVLQDFLVNSDYEMRPICDVEVYPKQKKDGVFCQLWIPIQAKA